VCKTVFSWYIQGTGTYDHTTWTVLSVVVVVVTMVVVTMVQKEREEEFRDHKYDDVTRHPDHRWRRNNPYGST